jgi:colanic acid/amylovoran biosynthesis glycosyltransferase
MPGTPTPLKLCIATKAELARTETFIRTHIERLPFNIHQFFGAPPHTDSKVGYVLGIPYGRRLLAALRGTSPLADDATRIELTARYLQRERFDVVLAEYGQLGGEMTAACTRAKIPLIVHFHGNDAHNHAAMNQWRASYLQFFQEATALVGVSRPMCDELVRQGAPAAKVHYIPYWVDTAQFHAADPAAAPPHFLAVGRFVEKKAPYLTLLAFAQVAQELPQARLIFIGDGPLLGPCQHLARHLQIIDRVDFLGAQQHTVVGETMRRVRALVQHSLRALDGDCEGMPLAITEAQASGLPVVSTRHAGIVDTVVEGATGYLVDEQDVAGMAAGMLAVGRDPQLAAALGRAGRERILTAFSRAQTLDRLAELITQAATGPIPADSD